MTLAPPGTLARTRQQRALDDRCARMRTCPHVKPAVGRGRPGAVLYDYVCPDCGSVRRSYLRERGRWRLVRRED